eukprot:m.243339 g.243339  ORF g.243339 m.243339 type:complete len:1172 (-) comp19447_c0_seq2:193-3708(-)
MEEPEESRHHWHCTDVTTKKASSSIVDHEWGCTSNVQFETSTPSDVPLIVTALLNAKVLGHVCLSCPMIDTNTIDSVLNMFHNILPMLTVYDSASSDCVDRIVQVTQFEKKGFRFDVTKSDPSTVYFHSSKIETRSSSTSQKLSHDRLLEQIMGISVSQTVNPAPEVTLSMGCAVNVRSTCTVTEEDRKELKEIRWWNVKDLNNVYSSRTSSKLKAKVVSEFRRYMMSVHTWTPHGEEPCKDVWLGCHEDYGALGIPLKKSWMKSIKTAVEEAASGLFPSPSCTINVCVSEVKMTQDDLMTVNSQGKHKELILLTQDACLQVRDKKLAGLFVAVKNKTGTMTTSMKVAMGCKSDVDAEKINSNLCRFVVGGKSHEVKCEFESLSNVDIMDHYVINIRSVHTSAKTSSSVLLRKDMFALCIYDASSVYSLSPFASWAWLSYRFQSPQFLRHLHNQDMCVEVTVGRHARTSDTLPALLSAIRPQADNIGHVDLHVLCCCEASDAGASSTFNQHKDITCFLVDTDSNRLRDLFKFLCKQSIRKVTIAGVFLVPSREVESLLQQPTEKAAPFMDSRSPLAQELIRDYLKNGKSPMTLWNKGMNVFAEGTILRSDVTSLEQSIFTNATKSGTLKIKYAVCLVPKSGTTSSLLQLVMRCNEKPRVYATYCSANDAVQSATEACELHDRVLLVLSDVSSHNDENLRLVIKNLGELKKRRACAIVVFYTIRASLFHRKLPVDIDNTFVFRCTTDAVETRKLIAKHSACFDAFAPGLKQLNQDFDGKHMLITFPALVLHDSKSSDFAHDHASEAVSIMLQSLKEYEFDGEYHRKYLLHLSLLTAMTCTRQVQLGNASFQHVRWQFLITNPTGRKHSLTSRLWIPVLLDLLAPQLQTQVLPKTYELAFGDPQQFSLVMTEALLSALKTGLSLRPWTHKSDGKMPVWLQNTKTHAKECLDRLCESVRMKMKECGISEGSHTKLERLLIQLHVLKVDVVRPKNHDGKPARWDAAIAALETLLQINSTYCLSLYCHGNTLLTAIVCCKHDSTFVSRHRSGAIHSLRSCLRSEKSNGETDLTNRICSRLKTAYCSLRQVPAQCNSRTLLMKDIEELLSVYDTQIPTEMLSPAITGPDHSRFSSASPEERDFSDNVFNARENSYDAEPVPAHINLRDELQWFLPRH